MFIQQQNKFREIVPGRGYFPIHGSATHQRILLLDHHAEPGPPLRGFRNLLLLGLLDSNLGRNRSKLQNRHRLVEQVRRLRDVDHHASVSQSPDQEGLEHPGQFGLPERNQLLLALILERLVGSNRFETSAQDKKRGVDVAGLLLPLARVQGFLDPLGSREIAEGEHGYPGEMGFRCLRHANRLDGEDAVAPTGVVVQARGGKLQVFPTDHHDLGK